MIKIGQITGLIILQLLIGGYVPKIAEKRELFPLPTSPTTATNDPFLISKLMFCKIQAPMLFAYDRPRKYGVLNQIQNNVIF